MNFISPHTRNFVIVSTLLLATVLALPRALRRALEPTALAAAKIFTVNVTGDGHDANPGDGVCQTSVAGNCSLRAAIEEANANAGKDTINFNIPGAGVHTISPNSALPEITAPVIIDGYSQPGASQNTLPNGDNAVLLIELSGADASASTGLTISAGNSTVQGLVVNRFDQGGIDVFSKGGNTIQGNFIGTNAAGTTALGNKGAGLSINTESNTIGGTTAAARNIISGTESKPGAVPGGILMVGDSNTIQGNFIGTDSSGTVALGNASFGIRDFGGNDNLIGGTDAGAGNVVSGNLGIGIQLFGEASVVNKIQGNFIGTDAHGTAALANTKSGVEITFGIPSKPMNNLVGGTTPAARNVISGNGEDGVLFDGAFNNQIQGNFIGTNATGTAALPNSHSGVEISQSSNNVIGGTLDGAGNVISGNGVGGVVITNAASGNTVQGNFIGTGADGSTPIGNTAVGVGVTADAAGNIIGANPVGGNTIAFNSIGVLVFGDSSLGNFISGNSIFNNTSLGIDLNNDGVTPNDVGDNTGGPNNLQNFPVLTSAAKSGDAAVVAGTINSRPNLSIKIELFSNPTCHPSGNGEGHKLISSTTVTTDSSGNASFVAAAFTSNLSGSFITGTATGVFGTSEFSKCRELTSATPTPTPTPTPASAQFSASSYVVSEGAGFVNLTVTRSGDTSGQASVNYQTSDTAGLQSCTTSNGVASERCDYTTSVGTVIFAPGDSTESFTIPLIDDAWVEGNEAFTVTLTNSVGMSLGTPLNATVIIVDNDSSAPTSNPIDGVGFFVRQQYLDVLNRLPDTIGYQNWVNTLSGCPNGGFGEPASSNCDRLYVAAGFFQSDEFLNRGYFAFRFYMVSFNQRPTYRQFISDMAQVGGPRSPGEEETAKLEFADAFVQRPEFLAKYPGLSGQPLAEALLQTSGLPAGSYMAGTQTNAQILRGIAESSAAFNKFLTEGTVSILYFAYQRRDPDTLGYQNNVNTLNANPNNLRHMVFIFIYSAEYRSRFGPP